MDDKKNKGSIRAAIYTRKSSEEGLEQEFNSLDAQREACRAYISSQKHEGWTLVEKEYSDGGISGGTLNRPAIQELLKDIKEGLVNMIVVYKIDRLTRSLHDFSKLVEIFDKHEASFVSITQQFNTSTSMGRLTLNMLLSFAQFEREIAGERVRDKKLAMAMRGMWVNGRPPHGYMIEEKRLVPDPNLREQAVMIFEKYLEIQSVYLLQHWLEEQKIPTRTGAQWSKGALYNMLGNATYIGKLPYKGELLDGIHEAIISKGLFESVQELLKGNNRSHRLKSKAKDSSLLASLLYGENGDKFYPSHSTKKNGKRYRYYLSKEVSQHKKVRVGDLNQLPAQEIEDYVKQALLIELRSEKYLDGFPLGEQIKIKGLMELFKPDNWREVLLKVMDKIIVAPKTLELQIRRSSVLELIHKTAYGEETIFPDGGIEIFSHTIEFTKVRDGASVIRGEASPCGKNESLKENIKNSFQYHQKILDGEYATVKEMAESLGLDYRHLRKVMALRFLAGDILQKILTDRSPAHWTMQDLYKASGEDNWTQQRKILEH